MADPETPQTAATEHPTVLGPIRPDPQLWRRRFSLDSKKVP